MRFETVLLIWTCRDGMGNGAKRGASWQPTPARTCPQIGGSLQELAISTLDL